MTTFKILIGKAIGKGIASHGKVAATFTEGQHQLAYSAINHVEMHHDAIYCNALFAATPANYRGALVTWIKDFGKVAFDATTKEFTYAKSAKSDLETALTVSPADYAKPESAGKDSVFDEVKQLEAVIKRFGDKGASTAVIRALKAALNVAKGEIVPSNVVTAPTLVKARKAKNVKPAKVATVDVEKIDKAA